MNEKPIIFQQVLSDQWHLLPEVFKRHYANRAYSNDRVTVKGTITVNAKGLMKWFGPIMGAMGLLPPKPAQAIPITVVFASYPDSNAFHLERIFYYPHHAPYAFYTKMIPLGDKVMVDLTRLQVGWKMAIDYQEQKMILAHRGFVFKIGKWFIPLPIEWLVGRCDSYEQVVDDNTFKMSMQFNHPWFGVTYEYFGVFTLQT